MKDSLDDKATPTGPTRAQLVRATLIAVITAGVLFVVAVMPAECGVDPTGLGSVFGLTPMGQLKEREAHGAPPPPALAPTPITAPDAGATPAGVSPSAAVTGANKDEVAVTLGPNEAAEVKAVLREGGQLVYEWTVSDGREVFFDFHGEPKGGANGEFTSFEKGSSAKASGDFVAPFEGTHGWYWKNRNDTPVTIVVKARGDYSKFSRMF
ncbi:MAG: hypothetical protein JNM38_11520 [Acidobacteria bacterium]|nr:hypothetical protein [Acidobacteriota bacterium]